MRVVLIVASLLTSCSLLAPDQLHVGHSWGGADSSGAIARGSAAKGFDTETDEDFDSWFVGLSWNLTATDRNESLERAARQMQIASKLLAARPVIAAPRPAVGSVPTTAGTAVGTDINITVQGGDQATEHVSAPSAPSDPVGPDSGPEPAGNAPSPEPQGVELLGVSGDVWTQLIVALSVLASALAAYLGRHKIPVVRGMTKKGREARAATTDEDQSSASAK